MPTEIISNSVQEQKQDKHLESLACIYKIFCKANGKCYVGSTVRFSLRKKDHIRKLKSGRHESKILQNAWNKYGEENMMFEILEVIEDKETIFNREQFFIDTLQPYFNVLKTVHRYRLDAKLPPGYMKSRHVNQYDLSGNFIKAWSSTSLIASKLKCSTSAIYRCCNGKAKTAIGYIFKWEDNYIPYEGSQAKRKYTDQELVEVKKKLSDQIANNYIITFPTGEVKLIRNLRKFCRENNVRFELMQSLYKNPKRINKKGWKVIMLEK